MASDSNNITLTKSVLKENPIVAQVPMMPTSLLVSSLSRKET